MLWVVCLRFVRFGGLWYCFGVRGLGYGKRLSFCCVDMLFCCEFILDVMVITSALFTLGVVVCRFVGLFVVIGLFCLMLLPCLALC